MPKWLAQIHEIHREMRAIHHELRLALEAHIIHARPLEGLAVMAALDRLNALQPRLDALLAAFPADIAAAVAQQKATDAADVTAAQDALATAQSDAATKEAALNASLDIVEQKLAALEAAEGITTPPAAMTAADVSAAAGSVVTVPLTITGGVAPFTVTGLPAGATFDGSNVVFDGSETAAPTPATVTDSSSPPLTATFNVNIT